MSNNELEKQLHDRHTRGEALSEEEQAQLQKWYAAQDRAEMDELNLTPTADTIAALQVQIDSALTQLAVITRRIQETAAENETLRREVADLHRQLAQQAAPRPI